MSNRSKAVVGLSLIFLLGGICGALVSGIIIRDNLRERQQLRTHEGFIDYFEHRLQLSATQRDSLRGEFDRVYDQLSDLRDATSAQYEAVIDTFTQRIGPRLTESQRALLREQELKLRGMVPHEKRPPRSAGNMRQMPPPPMETAPVTPPPVETQRTESLSITAKKAPAAAVPPAATPPTGSAESSTSPPEEDGGLGKLEPALRARLNLTNDQLAQIKTIFSDNRGKNATARSQYSTQPDVLRTMIVQNNREARRKIQALLSDTQRAQLKDWQMQRREQRRQRADH